MSSPVLSVAWPGQGSEAGTCHTPGPMHWPPVRADLLTLLGAGLHTGTHVLQTGRTRTHAHITQVHTYTHTYTQTHTHISVPLSRSFCMRSTRLAWHRCAWRAGGHLVSHLWLRGRPARSRNLDCRSQHIHTHAYTHTRSSTHMFVSLFVHVCVFMPSLTRVCLGV